MTPEGRGGGEWEGLTYGRVVLGGVVRLVRDGEREEVGVHAHLGVRLVDWRDTGGNKRQPVRSSVRRPAAERVFSALFLGFSLSLSRLSRLPV